MAAEYIPTPSKCPCGPNSRVGGFKTHHPDSDCDGEAFDGLLCRECADVVWKVLDAPVDLGLNGRASSTASGTPGPVDPVKKARFQEAVAYITAYHGTFGLILDLRADEAWGTKWFTMTERQVDAVLASKAREAQWAEEAKARNPHLQEALDYLNAYAGTFDFLLDLKARGQSTLSDKQVEAVLRCKARDNAAQRPSAGGTRPATAVTQDGFYKHNGQIVKVQAAVHGSGNLYAKLLTVHEYGTATWEYTPGLVTQLKEDERLTLEQAQEFGRLYGVCGVCGRTLTDEQSIADGIGPICSGRLRL